MSAFTEVDIGFSAEFSDPGRRVIEIDGQQIGVFMLEGAVYAYRNHCPHSGGPACQGMVIKKVEEIISADKTSEGMKFSASQLNVVCPWHGYEFDIRTGCHQGDSRISLKSVPARIESGRILIGIT